MKEVYKPWFYLLLTYALSWSIWFIGGMIFKDDLFTIPMIIGAFGPFVAGIILTGTTGQKGAVRAWLREMFNFRIHIIWYLLGALILPFLVAGMHHLIFILFGGVSELHISSDWLFYPLYLIPTALLSGGNEEPGWRGYLTPVLEKKYPFIVANAIVGVFWALWHLPLFLNSGWGGGDQAIFWMIMYCIPLSIVLSWLYKRSRRSIIPVMLLHAAGNVVFRYFPIQNDVFDSVNDEFSMIKTLVYWLIALTVLLYPKKTTLT